MKQFVWKTKQQITSEAINVKITRLREKVYILTRSQFDYVAARLKLV